MAYIHGIAERAVAGAVPSLAECGRMTDDDLLARLTAITGIGRWTAEMLLIFNLGRPDVLPVHDLGVRRGFQIARGKRKLPEPEWLARHGERWAPHRTAAALYLWRAADSLADGGWCNPGLESIPDGDVDAHFQREVRFSGSRKISCPDLIRIVPRRGMIHRRSP